MITQFIKKNKQFSIFAILFSTIFAFASTLGKEIYDHNTCQHFSCEMLASFSAFFCVSIFLFLFIRNISLSTAIYPQDTSAHTWKFFLFCQAIYFFCWLVVYLAYYPGIFSYDLGTQTEQAYGMIPLTNQHPILHTLLWKLCLWFMAKTSIEALTIYAVFSMLFLSFAFSYGTIFIKKLCHHKLPVIITILFFAVNPAIGIMSFIPVKDTIFAGFFFLYSISVYQYSIHHNHIPELILFSIFCCFFRNNAVYVIFLVGICLILFAKKRFLSLCIVSFSLVVFLGTNSILLNTCHVEDCGKKEMLSIPTQQIACVVSRHIDEISASEKDSISYFFQCDPSCEEIADEYNPRFADPIKNRFQASTSDIKAFLTLWYSLGKQYPADYIDAFLDLNLPYWYLFADTIDSYSNRAYIETGLAGYTDYKLGVSRCSLFPHLLSFYEKFASFREIDRIPVFRQLFSITLPFWLVLFCLFFNLAKSNHFACFICFPSLFLWLTYMAGPVSNFRYIFPIYVLYPIIMTVTFSSGGLLFYNR